MYFGDTHLKGSASQSGRLNLEACKVAASLRNVFAWDLVNLVSQLGQLGQLGQGVVLGFYESKLTRHTTPPVKNKGSTVFSPTAARCSKSSQNVCANVCLRE